MLFDFLVKAATRFSLRDKRSFEISEVEITGVNCIKNISEDTQEMPNHEAQTSRGTKKKKKKKKEEMRNKPGQTKWCHI